MSEGRTVKKSCPGRKKSGPKWLALAVEDVSRGNIASTVNILRSAQKWDPEKVAFFSPLPTLLASLMEEQKTATEEEFRARNEALIANLESWKGSRVVATAILSAISKTSQQTDLIGYNKKCPT
jgi:hypothetical protein